MSLKLTKRFGIWYVTGTEGDRRIRQSTSIKVIGRENRQCAEVRLDEIRNKLRAELKRPSKPAVTVSVLVDHYCQGKKPRHASTVQRIFDRFGDDTSIADAIAMIDDYRLEMHRNGLKPSTITNYLNNITAVFRYAAKRGWTGEIVHLEKPKVKVVIRSLKDSEVDALVEAAPPWLKPHLIMLRNTGLRTGELLTLHRDDVDLAQRRAVIRDTKNGEDRVIPLNSAACQVIRDLMAQLDAAGQSDGILFRNSRGEPFAYSKDVGRHYLYDAVAAAAARAGIRHVTPHMLRHTFATRLVEAGASIVVVQALGGWKTMAMAARYATADLRTQDQYANLISKGFEN